MRRTFFMRASGSACALKSASTSLCSSTSPWACGGGGSGGSVDRRWDQRCAPEKQAPRDPGVCAPRLGSANCRVQLGHSAPAPRTCPGPLPAPAALRSAARRLWRRRSPQATRRRPRARCWRRRLSVAAAAASRVCTSPTAWPAVEAGKDGMSRDRLQTGLAAGASEAAGVPQRSVRPLGAATDGAASTRKGAAGHRPSGAGAGRGESQPGQPRSRRTCNPPRSTQCVFSVHFTSLQGAGGSRAGGWGGGLPAWASARLSGRPYHFSQSRQSSQCGAQAEGVRQADARTPPMEFCPIGACWLPLLHSWAWYRLHRAAVTGLEGAGAPPECVAGAAPPRRAA